MKERENKFKNILITGDTGFIGRHLKKFLEKNEPEISLSGFSRSSGQDIRDYEQIRAGIYGKDLVINLAGTSTVVNSWKNLKHTVDTDAYGAINIFRACADSGIPVIHISSAEVYGSNIHPGHPMSENHPLHPRHPYGIAKKAAEVFAEKLMNRGHSIAVLRLFTQYGDGSQEPLERFIPFLVRNALSGKDLPIDGSGQAMRDWVFISDTAEAIWNARLSSSGFYNICTGLASSQNQVATKVLHEVKKLTNTRSRLINLPRRQNFNEVREQIGDPSKFFEETGWRAPTTLEEGIKKCVEFYFRP